jgi:hypothetical protein
MEAVKLNCIKHSNEFNFAKIISVCFIRSHILNFATFQKDLLAIFYYNFVMNSGNET